MRIFLLLSFFLSITLVQGQKAADPKTFANSITEDGLKKRLYIVASREFEGRETATEGQRKAAAYIENTFRSLGLKPGNGDSYQMYYPVFQDSLASTTLEINGTAFTFKQDFDVSMSNYASIIPSAETVFVGYGITDSAHDDYEGLDVRGKVVLALNSMPQDRLQAEIANGTFSPFGKQDAAQRHGAIAVLVVQTDFPRTEENLKGNMYQTMFRRNIRPNTFYVSEKVARSIMGESDYTTAKNGHVQPKTYPTQTLLTFSKITEKKQSSDVLGYLEGTDLKDQVLVISAHYDHLGKKDTVIYYGADDDGSGTVSVLQLAEAFSKAKAEGKGPRRSILFLANSGEEKGLWGSEFYAIILPIRWPKPRPT